MKKTIAACAAFLLASTAGVSSAVAAPIVYTLSGTYTGTFNGNAFTSFTTFTGIGDTATLTPQPKGASSVLLSSLTALSGGVTYTVLGTNAFIISPNYVVAGFLGTTGIVSAIHSPAFASYDGVSDLSVMTGTQIKLPYSFVTDKGSVVISKEAGLSFSAALSAVPEPATWALMIGGFGMVGAAMRRRTQQVRLTVAYA